MKFEIEIPVVGKGVLTSEHSQSSHGQPVFVCGNTVYGPSDIVSGVAVKDWALVSSQYTGSADSPWSDEICRVIETW